MVFQQAIRERLSNGFDVFSIELQEIVIIALLEKDVLAVGAAIVDMVISIEE
jgi:hypothetical protein